MWVDILTKPLQGMAFRSMRAVLMNCLVNYEDAGEVEEINSGNKTSKPVHAKKTVSLKKNYTTFLHTLQECVG
jgi:hypothetical protein